MQTLNMCFPESRKRGLATTSILLDQQFQRRFAPTERDEALF
ncbi:MAG TPA: hypothetical protein VK025_11735 [Steroidobacter sp.]|jgi:hypothetical protein|nr:hypothetical protein [Steroidobacteraceae bacterium]HLS82065.1 hypothetical protein [Steroidobacter sp.]